MTNMEYTGDKWCKKDKCQKYILCYYSDYYFKYIMGSDSTLCFNNACHLSALCG